MEKIFKPQSKSHTIKSYLGVYNDALLEHKETGNKAYCFDDGNGYTVVDISESEILLENESIAVVEDEYELYFGSIELKNKDI